MELNLDAYPYTGWSSKYKQKWEILLMCEAPKNNKHGYFMIFFDTFN